MGVAVGVAAGVGRGANGGREKKGGSRELHLDGCLVVNADSVFVLLLAWCRDTFGARYFQNTSNEAEKVEVVDKKRSVSRKGV